MQVWSLGREDPLEKEMATHSSILAWKIPWAEETVWLQSIGSQRIRHDWSNLARTDASWLIPIFSTNLLVWSFLYPIKHVKSSLSLSMVIFLFLTQIPRQWQNFLPFPWLNVCISSSCFQRMEPLMVLPRPVLISTFLLKYAQRFLFLWHLLSFKLNPLDGRGYFQTTTVSSNMQPLNFRSIFTSASGYMSFFCLSESSILFHCS